MKRTWFEVRPEPDRYTRIEDARARFEVLRQENSKARLVRARIICSFYSKEGLVAYEEVSP